MEKVQLRYDDDEEIELGNEGEVVRRIYVYTISYSDGPDISTTYRYPVLKVTPKRILVGGWYEVEHRLDRQELETTGKTWQDRKLFLRDRPAGEVVDVPYKPELKNPEPTLAEDQKEFAADLARKWFRDHPDGKVGGCFAFLFLQHDLLVTKKFIHRLGLAKKQQHVSLGDMLSLLESFVGTLQAKQEKGKVCYDIGPKWVRIFVREERPQELRADFGDYSQTYYCFVRKVDGGLYQSGGWRRPRVQTGILGYLDNYDPALVGKYALITAIGARWRKKNRVPK